MNSELTFSPFLALFFREVRRFMRVIFQTLATPLINTTLYLLIFGVSIGRQISNIHDYPYLAFLIPGLVMMGTLRNAFDNATGSIVTAKFCGELEDLRIVPLSPVQIAWANGLGSLVRGLLVGGVTLCIGILFYGLHQEEFLTIQYPFLMFILLSFGGFGFAQLGLAVSMISKSFEHVNAINTFILLPLIYLGGVFFSLDHLHPFWQGLSQMNPLLYLVNGLRYAMLGASDIPIERALVVTLFTTIFFHKALSIHYWPINI